MAAMTQLGSLAERRDLGDTELVAEVGTREAGLHPGPVII